MSFYFVYGSNMSAELMRMRCPQARTLGTAALPGWRVLINNDGFASIAPQPGTCVHGVLWSVTPRDLAALNVYEAVASGLYRMRMVSVRADGRRCRALVYVGRSAKPGRPRPGYGAIVVAAANEAGMPAPHLARLKRLMPSGFQGAPAR